jgi:isopropylmalate/homocitrate/citramalate synthase
VREHWIVPDRVEIHDVTLRDGEQTARIVFTPDEKVLLAQELDALGVASIEPGLPATPEDREVISTLAGMGLRAKVKPLVRVRDDDVAHAIDSGADAMVLEFGINPYLLQIVYDTTPEELTARVIEYSKAASDAGMEVEFMGWDTFRIPSLDYSRASSRRSSRTAPSIGSLSATRSAWLIRQPSLRCSASCARGFPASL